MKDISNNQIITLNRGDNFSAPLFINLGNLETPIRYTLTSNDKIYFGIMEANQPFECAIIRKMYTNEDLNEYGDIVIELESKDTQCLLPGTYYYQVKLEHINEDESIVVDTIIPKRKFFIVD